MDKTVREHIQNLEQKRKLLSAHLMDEADAKQRNQLESELRAVEAALKFYQDALETERRHSQWRLPSTCRQYPNSVRQRDSSNRSLYSLVLLQ